MNEITDAQPARFSTIRGTIDSYEYLGNCHPELCFISDILQPLRDYQLTIHQETASATGQAFVVHPYDFNELPDLSVMVGAIVSLTIGTDTTWSDSAGGDIPEVLAISVGGKMYSTPYALHRKLRFWDWVATGIAWIAPLVAYAVILWLVMFPAGRTRPRDRNNVSPVRGTRRRDSSKHVESQWTDYAIVSYSAWLFVGLVGGYILRVRAGSVEFWLLLFAYAVVPAVLATSLNLLEKRVGLMLPRALATQVVDYSTALFSPADIYRISMALGLTVVLEISAVLLVREALVRIVA